MRIRSALQVAAALLLVSAIAARPAMAVPKRPGEPRPVPSPITDRFSLRATYFSPSVDTLLRLDSPAGAPGTLITAEDDFGLNDSVKQGRLEFTAKIGKRNRLRMDFFKIDRFGDTVLNRTLNFGSGPFNVNERVLSSVDLRMLGFTNTLTLFEREKIQVGIGLGIHALEAELRGDVPARSRREEATGAGVFPTGALEATYRFTNRFSFNARGQYFSASFSDFDGSISDYHADVQFRWRPNMAFGLGWSSIRIALEVQDDDFPGRFDMKAKGPEAFVRVSF